MSTDEPKPTPYRWRVWKIAACAFAGVLVAAGGLMALGGEGEPGTTAAPSPEREVAVPEGEAFGPGMPPTPGPDAPDSPGEPAPSGEGTSDDPIAWSPALLRGGISFFAAFALAFAFRTFLRVALFFVGVWAASLFLLTWAGWIEVHWEVIDAAFESFAGRIGDQFESVSRFVTGSLPSAGMAGLGLFTGFRKR